MYFRNSEQYFMWIKAKTFGDEEIANKILKQGANPQQAKKFGRLVKNYDSKYHHIWNNKRYQVMVDANMLKFSQNEELKKLFLSKKFNNKHFVEASPFDTIWGIGCPVDKALDDKSNWKGMNLLGQALDEVREKLINQTL
ncbi:hypothetical protein BCR32DRAFT_237686 [Anaeromyces robustus]|uniref:NADAR domain-containing protein n=1 Tax=Anaeromyces robustus TaxID=1754192 RepID=A0A1Y1WIX4_9FUNG|nr:hypothetical protein BCR32DRAFT_237686 [Anaeromyces robustus]|eukprot:ORX73443.1 hypothetical protein BCR32DRAFT_237686 [Anaeromyces robustus]